MILIRILTNVSYDVKMNCKEQPRDAMYCFNVVYILKAKSNFTLFTFEYIYTRFDFKQMEHCH